MKNPLWLGVMLPLLAVMAGNLGVAVFGLVMATGSARQVFLVVAVVQSLVLLGAAAMAGWTVARRYVGPRQPDSPETDYHDPPDGERDG